MSKEFLETIKISDGDIKNLDYHQQRVDFVFKSLGKESSLILKDMIKDIPSVGLYRCRFIYSLDKEFEYQFLEYKKREVKTLKLIYDNSISYRYKYIDRRDLDNLFKQRDFCDDVLIVKNSYITDTTIANIAFFDNQDWITPKQPLLYGTTRKRLIDSGFLKQRDIKVEDIKKFTKIALMNAMIDFDIISKDDNLKDIIC